MLVLLAFIQETVIMKTDVILSQLVFTIDLPSEAPCDSLFEEALVGALEDISLLDITVDEDIGNQVDVIVHIATSPLIKDPDEINTDVIINLLTSTINQFVEEYNNKNNEEEEEDASATTEGSVGGQLSKLHNNLPKTEEKK
jgi:hypothetical protein